MLSEWWGIPLAVVGGLLALWFVGVAALYLARPDASSISEASRLVADLLRLLKRLVADQTLPKGISVRIALLLAYLALPLDRLPDWC